MRPCGRGGACRGWSIVANCNNIIINIIVCQCYSPKEMGFGEVLSPRRSEKAAAICEWVWLSRGCVAVGVENAWMVILGAMTQRPGAEWGVVWDAMRDKTKGF